MLRPIIPKEPIIPELEEKEIKYLTDIAFGKMLQPKKCDALFIFSGTHQGHWEKSIEAFKNQFAEKIIVTGGRSLTGVPHPSWEGSHNRDVTEAQIIISHLIAAGVQSQHIVFEDKSTNSLENVLYAKEEFDFSKIHSLMVVCKSHAAGRQVRTLKKHLPNHIEYVPFTFNGVYKNTLITRDNWMNSEIGKKRVWGEYLRIVRYGEKGDILAIEQ